jgi:hypothetical protein
MKQFRLVFFLIVAVGIASYISIEFFSGESNNMAGSKTSKLPTSSQQPVPVRSEGIAAGEYDNSSTQDAQESIEHECSELDIDMLGHMSEMGLFHEFEGELEVWTWVDDTLKPRASDYDSYDVDALLEMGQSGDAKAYYLAGMKLLLKQGDIESAKFAFLDAITLGYIPALKQYISMLGSQHRQRSETATSQEMRANAVDIAAWARLESRLSGVAHTPQLLITALPEYRTMDLESKALLEKDAEARAELLLDRINVTRRDQLGLDPLATLESEDVLAMMSAFDCFAAAKAK